MKHTKTFISKKINRAGKMVSEVKGLLPNLVT